MVTLAPSSTPRLGDSAIEKIDLKLTQLKKKNFWWNKTKLPFLVLSTSWWLSWVDGTFRLVEFIACRDAVADHEIWRFHSFSPFFFEFSLFWRRLSVAFRAIAQRETKRKSPLTFRLVCCRRNRCESVALRVRTLAWFEGGAQPNEAKQSNDKHRHFPRGNILPVGDVRDIPEARKFH